MAPAALYTSQNLHAPPLHPSAQVGFSGSSPSASGETSITSNTSIFFNRLRAYYGQMRRHGRTGTASPTPNPNPVNLRALSHAQGAVTGRGRRGRASRWCVSIRLLRGNAHIWRALYLLPALFTGWVQTVWALHLSSGSAALGGCWWRMGVPFLSSTFALCAKDMAASEADL